MSATNSNGVSGDVSPPLPTSHVKLPNPVRLNEKQSIDTLFFPFFKFCPDMWAKFVTDYDKHKPEILRAYIQWANMIRQQSKGSTKPPQAADKKKGEEEDDEEDNEIIQEDDGEDGLTYSEYKSVAMRDMHKNIKQHPGALVETSSLRSVNLPPVTFRDHCLHHEVEIGVLSDAQMESVIYSNMRFKMKDRPRPGFFLGDGAGVGKGRQIAAMIKQHWHEGGRRILWISASKDLRIDSGKDLTEVGAKQIEWHDSGIPSRSTDGITFLTYSWLIYGLPKAKKMSKRQYETTNNQDPLICANDLQPFVNIGPNSNLQLAIDWLQDCPEGGLLIFDESHKAKNLYPTNGQVPTQTGRAVLHIQEKLPDAKVVYSSATGASEPENMAYMVRLGLGGTGEGTEAANIIKSLRNAPLGTLEIAAMSMKAAGAYLARTLSYDGAEFKMTKAVLERRFLIMYERGCEVWMQLYDIMRIVEPTGGLAAYWGAHQRFFKGMLMAAKVPTITQMTKEALEAGDCVVIGLQSTGEAAANHKKSSDEPVDDIVSAPKMCLQNLVSKMITVPDDHIWSDCEAALDAVHKSTFDLANKVRNQPSIAAIEKAAPTSNDDFKRSPYNPSPCGDDNRVAEIRGLQETIKDLEKHHVAHKSDTEAIQPATVPVDDCQHKSSPNAGDAETSLDSYVRPYNYKKAIDDIRKWMLYLVNKMDLPENPLDSLIDTLGGRENVAELTGRREGMCRDEYGRVSYKSRGYYEKNGMTDINISEKNAFMNGNKLVAIISDASSTGISLQADKRAVNKRRRHHITLELPWSADKAIQQFGRSHRSNQVSAPIYQMVFTPCAGEYRFAAAAAKRLSSLGALLKGDRNALGAGSELKSFDVDTVLGSKSLEKFLNSFECQKFPVNGIRIPKLPSRLMLDFADISEEIAFFSHFTKRLDQVGLIDQGGGIKGEEGLKVKRFLNRLLGLPIDEQEVLFAYFVNVMDNTKQDMQRKGTLDRGIVKMDVKASIVDSERVHLDPQTKSGVFRKTVCCDSGKAWDDVLGQYKELMEWHSGVHGVTQHSAFYVSSMHYTLDGERVPKIKLVTVIPNENANDTNAWNVKVREIYPSGKFSRTSSLQDSVAKKQQNTGQLLWCKVDIAEAGEIWNRWYTYLDDKCSHGDNCKRFKIQEKCESGTRKSKLHILTGGLLPFWRRLRELSSISEDAGRDCCGTVGRTKKRKRRREHLDVVRVVTEDGEPIVGVQAVSKDQMDYFVKHLAIPPGTKEDVLLKKRGSAYYNNNNSNTPDINEKKKKRSRDESTTINP